MSKANPKGLRARASRAWDKAFRSPSTTAPPSRASTPAPSPATILPRESGKPGATLQDSLLTLPQQANPPLAPPSPTPSTSVPPAPASTLPLPSLNIPPAVRSPTPKPNGGISWSGLTTALRTLQANTAHFPPLQLAIEGLLSGFDGFEGPMRNEKECEPLIRELKMLSETLNRRLPESTASPIMKFIVETVQSIQAQVDLIARAQERDWSGRLLQAQQVREAITLCYQHIQALSRQLQIDTDLSARSKEQASFKAQLEDMKPAKLATYDSSLSTDINRRACTENTRTAVLSKLHAWLTDPNAPNVCWMNGTAGTGKTTIAYTFAQTLEKNKQLAASFFCTHTTAECRDVGRIIPTIAYQLARFLAPFLSSLCLALSENPDLLSRTISTQFEQMLKKPLLDVQDAIPKGLVVVIDALDECTAGNGVDLVLDLLLREAPNLPLKLFLTSRPEPSIRGKIQEQPKDSRSIYELHNVKESDVRMDIELYLRDELPSLTQSQIKQLAELSGTLFIYAATAVRYIRGGNQKERLKRMLSVGSVPNKVHAEIDALYRTILAAAFDEQQLEEEELERMKLVLWTAVCAREPMSIRTLAALSGIDEEEDALAALEPLRSVLSVSEDGSTVSTLHASFPDYMFNPARSSAFYCSSEKHNGFLAQRCFEVMQSHLHFNICGLESSYILDEEVPGLERRLDEVISPTLGYACRYWAQHLEQATSSDNLHSHLYGFLSERLLFWMEVMNLKRWIGLGIHVILTAKLWALTRHSSSELLRFIEDARNFVTRFAANPVSKSTPHIYVSALPFCHRSSTIYQSYWKNTHGLITSKGAGIEHRNETIIARWDIESQVKSVAFSPNGSQIAVGCRSGSILIKNAHDGTPTCDPLQGHTRDIMSVAFSPDSTRVASGSLDHTIRVWDSQDGAAIGAPFKGHTGPVWSIAFSPDGTRIVSGSADKTIRVWSAQDGATVFASFQGHTDLITSVTFSPDGTQVASGSKDKTVRMWNALDGSTVGVPFEGHTEYVVSVAFSPNGAHIASGSIDGTIRIWDTQECTAFGTPIRGHGGTVWSVAFSPNGTRIVSGSLDSTVRMWDARNGTPTCAPLRGHSDSVASVAFSPDGTRVISGSEDSTICIWNAQDNTTLDASLQGHTDGVWSVAFSPDGTRVVSGSSDDTVRMWNAQDGTSALPPIQGHSSAVVSVAFSPDGIHIISGSQDSTIRMWNAQDGTPISTVFRSLIGSVRSVAFSPGGSHITSGWSNKTICTWNVQAGVAVCEPIQAHAGIVTSVAFSPDGTRIISGSDDRTIRVWNPQDGTAVGGPLQGHTGGICSVAFSPDGTRIISGSSDKTIRVWDSQSSNAVGTPLHGHTGTVMSVTFSLDGARIISGSEDKMIRVWNTQDGTAAHKPIQGHTSTVTSVALPRDGTRIVSGSFDKTIRMWDPCANARTVDSWTIAEDGWVGDQSSRLLFWVPPDLAPLIPIPPNLWVIGPNGLIQSEYENLLLGDGWHGCYHSQHPRFQTASGHF